VSEVDRHYRKATRPAALSNARRLAGLATPAPLGVEPVAEAVLAPPALIVLVTELLPPVTVPDGIAAIVELPVSKKMPPDGAAGALVGAGDDEDEGDELGAAVLVLEAVELKTLVSRWRPPATEYLEAQVVRSVPSGQQTVAPVVSAAQ
jgi:hypothetical protein